ncbi:hypothetical protein ACFOKI_00805 [Sphingomonas qilianensis]|uniref:Uncharacterized protein n=1 Tax=Sphingomonas qilianensis TaxID=1736690 RepID=A0ABU9XW56_9SPHN
MQFFRHFNIVRAINDLRSYLAQEAPHKLGFLVLSVAVFGALLVGFTIDSREVPVYHREVTYIEQWPADRTDAEIIAQQKIDGPIEAKRKAELAARQTKIQQDYKKLDDKLGKLGI